MTRFSECPYFQTVSIKPPGSVTATASFFINFICLSAAKIRINLRSFTFLLSPLTSEGDFESLFVCEILTGATCNPRSRSRSLQEEKPGLQEAPNFSERLRVMSPVFLQCRSLLHCCPHYLLDDAQVIAVKSCLHYTRVPLCAC